MAGTSTGPEAGHRAAGGVLAAACVSAFVVNAAALLMAIWSALGVGLIALMARHRQPRRHAIERAAAAAASTHTIPTAPVPAAASHPPATAPVGVP